MIIATGTSSKSVNYVMYIKYYICAVLVFIAIMLFQYFVFIIILTFCFSAENHKEDLREQKKNLIKKYMKRLKKQEGIIRVVNGRGDYEGKLADLGTKGR